MTDNIEATFVHADGSITQIVLDPDGSHANPRENDGNVATLINTNSRTIDIDDDDEGVRDVRDHYGAYDERPNRDNWTGWYYDRHIKFRAESKHSREDMVRRYLACFRPEILHYADHWSAGDSYGWGYVTRELWEKAGWDVGLRTDVVTPEQAFDQEVKVYEQWANGEVYGYVHLDANGDEQDSCWGFLAYDNHRQIAEQATKSPIVEER